VDATVVASQNTSISQLIEQTFLIKIENKQIIDWFDKLATYMNSFMQKHTFHSSKCHTRVLYALKHLLALELKRSVILIQMKKYKLFYNCLTEMSQLKLYFVWFIQIHINRNP